MKASLVVMVTFAFMRIRKVINNDPYVTLNKKLFNTHALALFLYYFLWIMYEITHTLWILDPDYGKITDDRLIVLAACVLTFNLSSIFLNVVLFYMMDKITQPVQDEYYDSNLKRFVPFFVYLANCKIVKEHAETSHNTIVTAQTTRIPSCAASVDSNNGGPKES